MVLKFLGIGKKSGFFLEAPPADSQSAAAKSATESAKPVDPAKAHVEAKAVLTPTVKQISEATSKSKVVETAKEEAKAVKEEAKAALAPVAEKISEATSKVKKTLKEVNAEKKAKAEKGGAEKKRSEPAAPAISSPKPEPTLTNFATTLQANNTPRRRPGPSLDMFKDMAKQVNSRK